MAATAAAASASVTPQQDVALEEDDEIEEFEQGNRPAIVQSHRQARMFPLMLPELDDGNAPTNEDVQAWQVRNSPA